MGLLERVSTLIRANLNDMIDRAEDPEKMIKQVILDMENQYLQVKTQVAVSIADQHMLEKKLKENEDTGNDWMRKAERAVDKSEDDLARAALDRYQTSLRLAQSFREQVDDQKAQVDTLKGALQKLEQKLDEAKSKRDLLLARHRRSVALGKAARAQTAMGDNSKPIGIEAENVGDGSDPWPAVQVDAYKRGCAAILKHIGAKPIMCAGHKEFALPKGRKNDPNFDMEKFRADFTFSHKGEVAASNAFDEFLY